jgi:hypothetical protein
MFIMSKYMILRKQNFDYIQDTRVIYNTSSSQHCHALCHVMPSKVNAAYLNYYRYTRVPYSRTWTVFGRPAYGYGRPSTIRTTDTVIIANCDRYGDGTRHTGTVYTPYTGDGGQPYETLQIWARRSRLSKPNFHSINNHSQHCLAVCIIYI